MFLGLYMVDCLLNGFVNIIYVTLAGGLSRPGADSIRAIAAGRAGTRPRTGGASGGHPGGRAGVGVGPSRAGPIALADRYRSLGRSFKQEGRLRRGGGRLAAGPRPAGRPDGGPARRPGAAAAVVRLRQRPGLAPGESPRSGPSRPGGRRGDGPTGGGGVPRGRRPTGTRWGSACYRAGDDASAIAALDHATALGGGTAFDDVFLALAHARLGDLEEARLAFARAMIRAERDYPGHPELAGFCVEARSILAAGAG